MHELVRDAAIWIASDDQKALLKVYGDEVKEWPTEDLFKKYTAISLRYCKIPRFPEVPWEFPELKLLILENDNIGDSQEIPSKFFERRKELKVLDVTRFHIQSLPPSIQILKHLHTLGLYNCNLVDLTLVGQLTNLKMLIFLESKIKELPKEIGQLTRLQLLDLTGCSEVVVISPGMGIKSFKQWEGEGLVDGRGSNARVSELKHLSNLSALDIHIPDANLLPTNLFSDKLERYTILIGDCWTYPNILATSSNMLKLKLTRRNQFDRGIKLLNLHVQNNDKVTYVINSISWSYSHNAFPKLESLSLENLVRLESVCYGQLIGEPFEKLKSLTLRNLPKLLGFYSKGKQSVIDTEADLMGLENEFGALPKLFSNEKVLMPNLTTLNVHQCDSLRFLFSSSMAKCLGQLKNLKISNCQIMEEIVRNEENIDDMFDKLNRLELHLLPNLARFSSGSYIKFPSLAYLVLVGCTKLETFIFGAKSGNITTNKEESEIELFDEKVGFPSLEMLYIWDLPTLKTIFHNQLHSDSFGRLRIMDVRRCYSVINIFGPSIMGRLNALESLEIEQCQSLQVVYDTSSTTQLNGFECPNLSSIEIDSCDSLKNVFPASVAKDLKQLSKLKVKNCGLMEEIVTKVLMPNLTTLNVHQCDSLRFLFSSSMAKYGCTKLETFIFGAKSGNITTNKEERDIELFDKKVGFPSLEMLSIWGLPKLKTIFHNQLHSDSFGRLRIMDVRRCHSVINIFGPSIMGRLNSLQLVYDTSSTTQLNGFECPNLNSVEIHSCDSLKNVLMPNLTTLNVHQCDSLRFLFSSSMTKCFRQLKNLKISNCQIMEEISLQVVYDTSTTTQLNGFECPNLNSVEIDSCDSLKNVFPALVAKDLKQLSELKVKNCGLMEEIVVKEKGPQTTYEEFGFPKVTSMEFDNLPQLRSFYLGLNVSNWPSLNILKFTKCGGVEIFASEFSTYQDKFELGHPRPTEQPFFLIEKGKSFLNLEYLILDKNTEIWYEPYGPLPTVLSKLKVIQHQ
ncbi:disease resistance protein [Pyrus ussuriensis x Pyrus communis]|uniref:Disease resistance protein n=1 Tax=Pyrus ussuriensis x Pyrus communis TaxID=2448454 RepID=A0A5N5GA82_9ROSA|nr:disease resistance protein [Pyrus ussuriensis x Pyrus communis]